MLEAFRVLMGLQLLKQWNHAHHRVLLASFLGWMLDAFDYFLVVFVLRRLSVDFRAPIESLTWALTLTLMMRPLGAFIFGRLADRSGRRPALMASVLLYSAMELASAVAPSLRVFLILRALYGVAMGGEWGVGASLAFETVPVRSRGWVSGLLQAGYPSGYLLAAIVFGVVYPRVGWRGMFAIGATPALLLVLYIRSGVQESPVWLAQQERQVSNQSDAAVGRERGRAMGNLLEVLAGRWPLVVYAALLMTAFNFFSHGTQDLYPTFLGAQKGFSTGEISRIAIIYNIGAILGGLFFGRLSGRIGRRRAIALAAVLALPSLPVWVLCQSTIGLAAAAFVMQFMVQGAWGVVPVHLNELSPEGVRATFPGVVYQLGNLIASSNATLQVIMAIHFGNARHPDYGTALAIVGGTVALALAVLALLGPERRDVQFGGGLVRGAHHAER